MNKITDEQAVIHKISYIKICLQISKGSGKWGPNRETVKENKKRIQIKYSTSNYKGTKRCVIWLLLQKLLISAYTNKNLHYLHHNFYKNRGVFFSIKLLLNTQTLAGDCNRKKNHVGESEKVFHFVKQRSRKTHSLSPG
jgi:hypothetical protein